MKGKTDKYFKKTKKVSAFFVTILIIFSILWTPFDNIYTSNVVYAQQNVSGGYDVNSANSFSAQSGVGLSGYLKALSPVISKLPLCQKVISAAVGPALKSLFKNVKGLVSKIFKKKKKGGGSENSGEDSGTSLPTDSNKQADAIEVKAPVLEDTTAKIDEKTEELKKTAAKQAANDQCLKSIGQLIARVLLQKTVLSMQAWIQNGFEGKPFFVQDYKGFFRDIYKNEVLQFGAEIISPQHPYGKDFLQSTVNALNTKFQDNARYSLNEFIQQTTPQYTAVDFGGDFSMGGWNAWNYMTTTPANNPLGFQIIAANELTKRVGGASKSTATIAQEALTQAGGFLGQEICVDPEGITHAQHDEALVKGKRIMKTVQKPVIDQYGDETIVVTQVPTERVQGACYKWKYQTAGEQIMHKANMVIDYPENGILEAKDLNTALVLLLDSVMAHFSSKLQEGFADANNEGSDGAFLMSGANDDGGGYTITQTEKDFTPVQLGSHWLEENPDFNIRTDITQALIDEQRTYTEKLTEQNMQIPQLIMDIRQLDYCIPGPNPKVEITSSVDNFYNNISARVDLKAYNILGTVLDIVLPAGGSALSGIIGFDPTAILSGIATALLDEARENKIKAVMATYLGDLFEVHILGAGQNDGIEDNGFGDNSWQEQVLDEGDIRSVIDNTWNSYMDNNYKIYFNGAKSLAAQAGAMPYVTEEARNEFNRIEGYEKMAERNYDAIQSMKGLVVRLTTIKDAVDKLNASMPPPPSPLPAGTTLQDFLEAYWETPEYMDGIDVNGDGVVGLAPDVRGLRSIIIEFARISNDMVSGDDIAVVHNTLNEIKSERDYVWDDLLTGEGGCEKELELLYNESIGLPANENPYSKFVRRQPYTLPIYYFYGSVAVENEHTVVEGVPTVDIPWNARIAWDPKLLKDYFSDEEGFQYGMVYYNRWAGPDGPSGNHAPHPDHDMDGDGLKNGDILENNVDGDFGPPFTFNNTTKKWEGTYEILDDQKVDTNLDGVINDTEVNGIKDAPNGSIDDIVPPANHYDCPVPTDPKQCDDDPDPYDVDVPYSQSHNTPLPNPGDKVEKPKGHSGLDSSRMSLCPEYIQFPEDTFLEDQGKDVDGDGAYVEISLPGPEVNGVPTDIGGLEPRGWGFKSGNHSNDYGYLHNHYRNMCGVITRRLEKIFQMI